jgi:hypothetical protein
LQLFLHKATVILLDRKNQNQYHRTDLLLLEQTPDMDLYRILFALILCAPVSLAQEAAFVPPIPVENANTPAADSTPLNDGFIVASRDSVLGDRIAKISATMDKIPQENGQIWREYDITPFTKERKLPAGSPPAEQMLIDWILRKTGAARWHTAPFGILTADSEKLYVYHTKEVQLLVADIVDRFVCPQLWNEVCTLRIVSTSRPDWLNKGHSQLKPIPIATQGVQGWIVEKVTAQTLLQELGRRGDFKELLPPQPLIAHGIQHNVVAKKQRQYLRDVQPNPSALNGYAEDRVTVDEGIGLSMTPLAMLDGQHMAATIKLDVVQVERMFTTTIEIATAANPRQRVQIESPQMASFKLDEVVGFPKNKVLLLDLGTVPLPSTTDGDSRNVLAELSKGINPARRGNVLIFVECSTGNAVPAVTAAPSTAAPVRTARPLESPYWQGIR